MKMNIVLNNNEDPTRDASTAFDGVVNQLKSDEMTEDWVHTRITEHDKAPHLVGRKSPPDKKLWNAHLAGVTVVKK